MYLPPTRHGASPALAPPLVTLNGVALSQPATTLTCRLTAGTQPTTLTIHEPRPIADQLWAMRFNDPTTNELVIRVQAAIGAASPDTHEIRVRGLRIIARADDDPADVAITLADLRHDWRGRRHTGRYNITRPLNDVDIAALDPTPPSSTGAYIPMPASRYQPWSRNPATGRPWTALEIAEVIATELAAPPTTTPTTTGTTATSTTFRGFVDALGNATTRDAIDDGYQPDNLIFNEDDAPTVLAQVLALAQCDIAIALDGTFAITPAHGHPAQLPTPAPIGEGSGRLTIVDRTRERPRAVIVRAIPEFEIDALYIAESAKGDGELAIDAEPTGPDGRFQPPSTFRMRNMIALPFDETIAGADHARGSFADVDDALTAWGLSHAFIREHWLPRPMRLIRALLTLRGHADDVTDRIAIGRATAIYKHYRRTFRLEARLVSRATSLRLERIAHVNRDTGRPSPSPVRCPYTLVLDQRPPTTLTNAANDQWHRAGIAVDTADVHIAPATVEWIEASAGLLRIAFDDELGRTGLAIEPGTFDAIPDSALNTAAPMWGGAVLRRDWQVRLTVSVRFATPNAPSADARFVSREFETRDVVGVDGAHEAVELLTRREVARHDMSGARANADILDAVMINEARLVLARYRDRVAGDVTFDGLHAHQPTGGLESVSYQLHRDGRATTTLRAELPADRVPIELLLPADMRALRGA